MTVERRLSKRLIKRLPMRVSATSEVPQQEQSVESMNISLRGTYFATEGQFCVGDKIEVLLKMPEVLVPGQKTEWRFIGRVTHVDRLGKNGRTGVGVHFLYYSACKMNC